MSNDTEETPAESVAIFDNHWSPTLSFAASLGRRKVPLHFYGDGAGNWSRYRTRRAPCPPVEDADRFLPWLEHRIRSGEIHRVAPTTDLIAFYTALLRDEFAPQVRRTIAPLEEIECCLLKTSFAAACERIGQPVPASVAGEDLPEVLAAASRLGFPLMLKPRSHLGIGPGERGRIIPDLETLRLAYRPYEIAPGQGSIAARYPGIRWPLLQRYVPSARTRVYSISGIKDPAGGIVAASLSYKRHQWPPDTGISTSQVTCRDPSILRAGLATVDRLVSRGIFELELLDDDGHLLAIDLNPRAFGFIALDMAVGNDLPWLWYRSTLGPIGPPASWEAPPIMAARLALPALIGGCIGLLRRDGHRDTAARQEDSRPVRSISMLGHLDDPLPMLIGHWHQLRHPGSLIRPYLRPKEPPPTRKPLPDAW